MLHESYPGRSDALFRALLDAAPDAIVTVDEHGLIVLASAHTERLFGYDRSELVGQPVEILIPERFRPIHTGHRVQYTNQPRTRPMGAGLDLAGRRKDGTEFPVEISLSPLETEDGPLVISVIRDVTEQKRDETALKQTAAELAERGVALERTNAELHEIGEAARRHSLQLAALHEAGLVLSSDLSLEAVLQRVIDLARELVGARYGALGVLDEFGNMLRFITSGLSAEERARLGDPPKGRGLLGAVLSDRAPVRVGNIQADERSIGFPAGHPRMTTFLGVPIVARDRTYGNLYLTDKQGPDGSVPFNQEDEDFVQLFAAQAAVAIDNARLHGEVQGLAAAAERDRIARELHDSLAQALGYVRLRATSARDALRADAPNEADQALAQIGDVAGEAYADVREAILGLRSGVSGERHLAAALSEYLERYRLQTGVVVGLEIADAAREARLPLGAEAQLLRVIQEALTNVRKHAKASRVTVRLDIAESPEGPRLRASVADDGRGFDPARLPSGAHFGLATMRERAESVGGQFRVESAIGQGTLVEMDFPLESGTGAGPVSPAGGS